MHSRVWAAAGRGITRVTLVAAVSLSCSGAPPPASVTGTWVGSFTESGGKFKGNATFTVTDDGGVVTGTLDVSTIGTGVLDGTYTKSTGRWAGNLETGEAPNNFGGAYELFVSGSTGSGKYTMLGGSTGDIVINRPR